MWYFFWMKLNVNVCTDNLTQHKPTQHDIWDKAVWQPSNKSKSCRSSGSLGNTSEKSSWFSSRSFGMSAISLVMSSGSSSALSSGVEGLATWRWNGKFLVTNVRQDMRISPWQRICSSVCFISEADLMLACEGIMMLVEGIPRFPCGSAGGMGFWGLRGPLLFFFLCFLVSAGGLVFLRGFRCCCCWCCTRRLPSPRRKLSFKRNKTGLNQASIRSSKNHATVVKEWTNPCLALVCLLNCATFPQIWPMVAGLLWVMPIIAVPPCKTSSYVSPKSLHFVAVKTHVTNKNPLERQFPTDCDSPLKFFT